MPSLGARGYMRAERALEGELILTTSASHQIIGLVAATLVISAAALSVFAQYTRYERIDGWLVPAQGLIRVQARQDGWVEKILVREGDRIRTGQPMVMINKPEPTASGDVGAALARDLATETQAAQQVSAAAVARAQQDGRGLASRLGAVQQQIADRKAQLDLAEQKLVVAKAAYERRQGLARAGYLAAADLEAPRLAVLGAESDAATLRGDITALQGDQASLTAQLDAQRMVIAGAQASGQRDAAHLRQQTATLEGQRNALVTAPIDGRVVAVPVDTGQALAPGSAVAVLVPEGSGLTAELYAPSRSMGLIRPGQSVRIRYQAFPIEAFGAGSGRVLGVSRTVLAPEDVKIPGARFTEPVFRVRVLLDRDWVDAGGQRAPLQPGMLLSADVAVERRSLISWLLPRPGEGR